MLYEMVSLRIIFWRYETIKKALKIIGLGVISITAFKLCALGGYEMAWYELFTRKHYGATHMLEDVARNEWKKTPKFIFYCWTQAVRNQIRETD